MLAGKRAHTRAQAGHVTWAVFVAPRGVCTLEVIISVWSAALQVAQSIQTDRSTPRARSLKHERERVCECE
jgi:hypothetical protein